MSRFVLASNSPRRRELLSVTGYDFEVFPSGADETLPDGIDPESATRTLAERKCLDVLSANEDAVVLGCDTVVALDGMILGKPKDEEDAFRMLSTLSGRTHTVFSGVCIASAERKSLFCERTNVTFFELSEETIRSYIKTGEPMDKAGAYGIQAFGSTLVRRIDGDYFNVVGLPLAKSQRILASFGINGTISLPADGR